MKVSIIIIHYHTPILLEGLVNSFFSTTDIEAFEFEIIVVNNGGKLDPSRFQSCPIRPRIMNSHINLGYAGGINKGESLSNGEMLIIMNSDLILHDGSIEALLEVLENYDIAGPSFYLDREKKICLPPRERMDITYEVIKMMSMFYPLFRKWSQRLWRGVTYSHIFSCHPKESFMLSGALLALTREAWNRVGPMDEGFKFYFEETDWLLRSQKKGLKSVYHPGSKVTHIYNQSAQFENKTQEWFVKSAKRFSKKHDHIFKRGMIYFLKKFPSSLTPSNKVVAWNRMKTMGQNSFDKIFISESVFSVKDALYMEISIFNTFVPSAVMKLEKSIISTEWSLPMEVWQYAQPGQYFFRIIDSKGTQRLPLDE